MKVYYVIMEGKYFTGYTRNKFLLETYCRQIENHKLYSHENFIAAEMEVRVEEEFINTMNQYLKFPITVANRLHAIDDKFSGDILVINDAIYESFVESFMGTREMNKRVGVYFRHFLNGNQIDDYIIGKHSDVVKLISLLIQTNYYPILKKYLLFGYTELYIELMDRDFSTIWEILNEYTELKNYFNFLLSKEGLPFL